MKSLSVGAEFFHEEGRADKHDQAYRRFSQFCEKRLKICIQVYNTVNTNEGHGRWGSTHTHTHISTRRSVTITGFSYISLRPLSKCRVNNSKIHYHSLHIISNSLSIASVIV
jgi:hypothetical protein